MKIYLNSDDWGNSWNKKRYLQAADERLNLDVFHDIKDADAHGDYILNIEPFTFKTGYVWTGIWQIDTIFGQGKDEEWERADNVFIAVSSLAEHLEKYRGKTTLLFQACDPTFNRRYKEIEPKFDFVVCGSGGEAYKERERLYELMESKYTYESYGKGRSPQEYSKILNNAKVQFIRSANTNIADGEIAQRFFECLAIGPVLTNWVDDLKHTGLVEGEDYMAYRNDKEMFKKMDLLLKPKINQKIMANGRKKALLCHTYEHRINTILSTINERTF